MEFLIPILLLVVLIVVGIKINKPKETKQTDLEKFKMGTKTKECPICQTKNNVNRKYCRHCNTWIKNITCPVCEHVNPFDQKYCEKCESILRNKTRY